MAATVIENGSYDYVVVGSGSSGAVVAARLSENPRNSVLLLEAGPTDDNAWMKVPLGFTKILPNPKYMWHLRSDPEPHMKDRAMDIPRGKVLGGSSTVNGMVYVRGSPSDYDGWQRMGAAGWSYEDVLPYFRKAECQSRGADEFHGGDGPLSVEDNRWPNELAEAFIAAAQSIGLPRREDFCRRDIEGVGYYQATTRGGLRASTAVAYLKPARARPNLQIVTDALVTRIEFEGREARAVHYERGGQSHRVPARSEIILSAGSFGSPQILQRSGVGPANVLQDAGVAVVHELKGVGENLMDHLLVKRSYKTTSRQTLNVLMGNALQTGIAALRYAMFRTGPLAGGPAPVGGYAFTQPGAEAPDIQFFYIPFDVDIFGADLAPHSSFQISFYKNRPEARGRLRIVSLDPHEAPRISINYLAPETDARTVVAGLRLIGRIGRAAPLAKMGAAEILPGLTEESDDALLDYARGHGNTAYHHVGTCRIGTDEMAVVDPQLRVRGLSKLRVADGSVMPSLPSCNTHAACVMIGEKCADLLRQ